MRLHRLHRTPNAAAAMLVVAGMPCYLAGANMLHPGSVRPFFQACPLWTRSQLIEAP